MKSIKIRKVKIGEGIPKICIPILGKNIEEIMSQTKLLKNIEFDLVEIRADFFEDIFNISKITNVIYKIRNILGDTPIIFTFRSFREGGKTQISEEFYFKLNKKVCEMNLIDIIDIELCTEKSMLLKLVEIAHSKNIKVIISNHDFNETPEKEEIISRLVLMQELGADITKIAVMPKYKGDVLTLLNATNDMKLKFADRPFITISMGGQGTVSRITGEIFGSSVTFASLTKCSAPGQLSVQELKNTLNIIHKQLN